MRVVDEVEHSHLALFDRVCMHVLVHLRHQRFVVNIQGLDI
jgi:hypothetical protein